MPLAATVRRALVLLAALALVAGCASGGDEEPAVDPEEVDELSPVPDPLASLAEPPPGQGVAVFGIDELSFEVTRCAEGPAPGDTPEATLDFVLEGTGETSDGAFQVEISRYRSTTSAGSSVITETAKVVVGEGDQAVGIEAKRTTAGADGTWQDLTDPSATGPLVERRDDAVDVRARFGPEGAVEGDEGIDEGRIRAACPAG